MVTTVIRSPSLTISRATCLAVRPCSPPCADAKPVFRRLFQEFGLPQRMRSDNGVPFATVSLARLSTLSAWFIRLGIIPELIEPGKPQQNGRHERRHRTLKAEATRPPQLTAVLNSVPSTAFALSSITSGHTRRWRWKRRRVSINHHLVPFPPSCRRLSTPHILKLAMLATTAAVVGTVPGSTSVLPAPASMLAGRRSTTEFGTCILGL